MTRRLIYGTGPGWLPKGSDLDLTSVFIPQLGKGLTWREHLSAVRNANPSMTFKQVQKLASSTFEEAKEEHQRRYSDEYRRRMKEMPLPGPEDFEDGVGFEYIVKQMGPVQSNLFFKRYPHLEDVYEMTVKNNENPFTWWSFGNNRLTDAERDARTNWRYKQIFHYFHNIELVKQLSRTEYNKYFNKVDRLLKSADPISEAPDIVAIGDNDQYLNPTPKKEDMSIPRITRKNWDDPDEDNDTFDQIVEFAKKAARRQPGRPVAAIASAAPAAAAAAAPAAAAPHKRTIMRRLPDGRSVPQIAAAPIVIPASERSRSTTMELPKVEADPSISRALARPRMSEAEAEAVAERNRAKLAPKKAAGERKPNPWLEHVAAVRAELPAGTKYKDVLIRASATYLGVKKAVDKKTRSVTAGPWDPDEVKASDDAITMHTGDIIVPSRRRGKKGTLIRINRDIAGAGVLDEPGLLVDIEGGALIQRGWNDQAKRILDGYGDWQIVDIVVRRAPVQAFVTGLLNTVTFGGYSAAMKSAGYDEMFHLGHVLTLRRDDGATKRVMLEKNEVVNLSDKIPNEKDLETRPVAIPSPFKTLNEYVQTTLDKIGTGSFFLYDSRRRNCQRFIMDNLTSNDINTPELTEFISQEAESIFKKLPGLQEFARTLTDMGAVVAHVKDEVVGTAKDVERGAKVAIRATTKVVNRGAKRLKKLFGRGIGPDGMMIQSVLIDRKTPMAAALRFCDRHGLDCGASDETDKYHRFRQAHPSAFDSESFKTLQIAPGVKLIVGMRR